MCLHIDTQTQTAPKENSNPRNNHKSKFYCPGCDGNSQLRWASGGAVRRGGAEAAASGGAHSALAPTQPQGKDAFVLLTHPSQSPPRAVTPSSLHCHLKSGPTLSRQPEPQSGLPPKDFSSLWLVGRNTMAWLPGEGLGVGRGSPVPTTSLG